MDQEQRATELGQAASPNIRLGVSTEEAGTPPRTFPGNGKQMSGNPGKDTIPSTVSREISLKGVVSSDDSGQRTHSQGLEVGIGTSAGKALIEARSPGFRFAHVEGKLCPSWSSLVEPAIVGGTGAAPGASRCWPQSFSPSRVHALRQVPSQLLPRMGIKSSLASEFEAWRGNGFGWKESRQ